MRGAAWGGNNSWEGMRLLCYKLRSFPSVKNIPSLELKWYISLTIYNGNIYRLRVQNNSRKDKIQNLIFSTSLTFNGFSQFSPFSVSSFTSYRPNNQPSIQSCMTLPSESLHFNRTVDVFILHNKTLLLLWFFMRKPFAIIA